MKKLALFMALSLTASAFAGCSPSTTTGTNNTTKAPETQSSEKSDTSNSVASSKDVTIKFWNFPNFAPIDDTPGKYEENLVAAFEAKNPGIKVEVEMLDWKSGPEKITTAITGGTAPDIIYDAPGRIIDWGKKGVLAPLDDMFTSEFTADVSEGILDACKSGSYWMYPTFSAPFMMAFNKDMLVKHDLLNMLNLEGDRTWTLDQYEALLKALKDKGENGAVIFCQTQGGDQGTRAFIANLYGSEIINSDLTQYTINDENGVKSLEWTVNAIKNGLLLNGSASDGNAAVDEFVAERASHTILFSPGLWNQKKENMDFEPVFVPFPSPEKPKLEFIVGGLCVFNNKDQAKIDASKKFIDFIANDSEWGEKNVVATGSFPVKQSMTGLYDDPELEYNASMTSYYGTYYNTANGFAEMRTFWFPSLQAAIGEEKTPKEALDYFVEKSNPTLKQ